MEEQEWLNSPDLTRLLELIRSTIHARKLRLFAVACCRRINHLLTDPRSRHMVDLAEQIADDRQVWDVARPSIDRAREAIHEVYGPINGLRHELTELLVDDRAACIVVFFLIWRMEIEAFQDTATVMRYTASRFAGDSELLHQCELLRCVVGNP